MTETWYEKNSEKLSKKRKERYRHDKAYRDKAKEYARNHRRKVAEGHKPTYWKDIEWKGRLITVYSLGHMAAYVQRCRTTLLKWEKEGYIPKPVFPERYRWYTEHQCNLIGQITLIFDKYANQQIDDRKLRDLDEAVKIIEAGWMEGLE